MTEKLIKKNTKVENIKKLFKETNLTQDKFAQAAGLSTRSFQRILKGDVLKNKFYEGIASALENKLNKQISISQILETSEDNTSINEERCNLYNVSDMPDLIRIQKILSDANKVKLFMPTFYSNSHDQYRESGIIESVVNYLLDLKDNENYENDEFDYNQTREFIKRNTSIPRSLTRLKEKKISLYMGNFNLPCFKIGISKKDGSQGYEKYNENYAIILFESNIDIRGDLIAKKDERPSAIKNFYYNNPWPLDKIQKTLKKIEKNNLPLELPFGYKPLIDRNCVRFESNDYSLARYIFDQFYDELLEVFNEDLDIVAEYNEYMSDMMDSDYD